MFKGNIRQIYFRYLCASFGSALITSICSVVDMAMAGKYQGPEETAALAVAAPLWNLIYDHGLLMGIGGSVIFSIAKGSRNIPELVIHYVRPNCCLSTSSRHIIFRQS